MKLVSEITAAYIISVIVYLNISVHEPGNVSGIKTSMHQFRVSHGNVKGPVDNL